MLGFEQTYVFVLWQMAANALMKQRLDLGLLKSKTRKLHNYIFKWYFLENNT